MTITKDNMHQAIAALRQCAKENENRQTDTGAVRVTDLCNDVADYLERTPAKDLPTQDLPDTLVINGVKYVKAKD